MTESDPVGENTIGLLDVKCDSVHLFKLQHDQSRMFEIELSQVLDLAYRKSFRVSRAIVALVNVAAVAAAQVYLVSRALAWTVTVIAALVALAALTDLWDKKIAVSTRIGDFELDVHDVQSDADVEAFIVSVRDRCSQDR